MKEKNKDLQSFIFVSVFVSCTRSVSHLLEEHKRAILLYNASQGWSYVARVLHTEYFVIIIIIT